MDLTVMSAWALLRPPNGLELDTPGIDSYSSIPGTTTHRTITIRTLRIPKIVRNKGDILTFSIWGSQWYLRKIEATSGFYNGCLPFTQKTRKFGMECKWTDLFCLPERKFYRENGTFLKGRPKFPNGISEWKCAFHLLFFTNSEPFGLDRLLIAGKKSWKWERAHPTGNFHLGFDAYHSPQLSTDRFFQVNGKQATSLLLVHFITWSIAS